MSENNPRRYGTQENDRMTARGFEIYSEIRDDSGQEVRIQRASSVDRRCWIFCQKDGKDCVFHINEWQAYAPYLTPAQARRVARALLKFANNK